MNLRLLVNLLYYFIQEIYIDLNSRITGREYKCIINYVFN